MPGRQPGLVQPGISAGLTWQQGPTRPGVAAIALSQRRSTSPLVAAAFVALAFAAGMRVGGPVCGHHRIVRRAEATEVAKAVPDEVADSSEPDAPTAPAIESFPGRKASNARKTAVETAMFDPAQQTGVTEPFGFFDPLGFCPPNNEMKFRKLRTSELKHGRIAMMASVGLVVQHFIRIPTGTFDLAPSGVMAIFDLNSLFGLLAVVFGSLVVEFFPQDPSKDVGDFGDPWKVGMDSREMRDRELNNGRAAMFATIGIIAAELATQKDAVQQLGF